MLDFFLRAETFSVTSVLTIDHIRVGKAKERVTVGSCGFYIAMALANMGADVLYAGAHGDDFEPDMVNPLREAGAQVMLCELPGPTARLYLQYSPAGNVVNVNFQESAVSDFRAHHLPSEFWERDILWLGTAPYVFLGDSARRGAKDGKLIFLSTQGEFKGHHRELAKLAPQLSMLFTNSGELEQFGFGGMYEALKALRSLNPKIMIVITRGARGAWSLTGDYLYSVPPTPNPEIVNTIGAGDTFAAAYAMEMGRDVPVSYRLQRGAAAAALQMRDYAYLAMPSDDEVVRYMSRDEVFRALAVKKAQWDKETARSWIRAEESMLKRSG